MKVQVKRGPWDKVNAEVLILPCFEAPKPLGETALAVDAGWLSRQAEESITSREFSGRKDQSVVFRRAGPGDVRKVVFVGVGSAEEFGAEGLRRLASSLVGAFASKAESLAIVFDDLPLSEGSAAMMAQSFAEGVLLTTYSFDRFKKSEKPKLSRFLLVTHDADFEPGLVEGAKTATEIAAGVATARDLANLPGNHGTPEVLALAARRIGKAQGLEVTIHGRKDLEDMNMGSFLSVSLGSPIEPKLIVMEWGKRKKGRPSVALVGKGLTFDSGGISIKSADGLDKMRYDKSGGAAVIGAMEAIARLKLPIHCVGLVPASENMPGGNANKPGDVVRAANGTTIEILNTDAEGRLILADALVHAQTFKPDLIIDLATLTGACMVALGSHCAGLMTNDDDLARRLEEAGNESFERVWRLPLWDEYAEEMKGTTTDLKNLGGRYGGALTAAGFLKSFVGKHKWAHLDIAGVAWDDSVRPYNRNKGATGYGVRLLVHFLKNLLR